MYRVVARLDLEIRKVVEITDRLNRCKAKLNGMRKSIERTVESPSIAGSLGVWQSLQALAKTATTWIKLFAIQKPADVLLVRYVQEKLKNFYLEGKQMIATFKKPYFSG